MAEQDIQFEEPGLADRMRDRVESGVRIVATGTLVLVAAACSLIPAGDKGDGPYTETFDIGVDCPDGTASLDISTHPVAITAEEASEAYTRWDDIVGGEDDEAAHTPAMDTILTVSCVDEDGNKEQPLALYPNATTKFGQDGLPNQYEKPDLAGSLDGLTDYSVKIEVDGDDQGEQPDYSSKDPDTGEWTGDKDLIGTHPVISNISAGEDFRYGFTHGSWRNSSPFPTSEELDALAEVGEYEGIPRYGSNGVYVSPEVDQAAAEVRDSAVFVIEDTELEDGKPSAVVTKS